MTGSYWKWSIWVDIDQEIMRFSSYAPCTIQRYPILFSRFFSLSFFRKVDLIHLPYPYFRLFKLSFCALISVSAFLRYFYFVSHFLCLTLSFYLKNCITRCSFASSLLQINSLPYFVCELPQHRELYWFRKRSSRHKGCFS